MTTIKKHFETPDILGTVVTAISILSVIYIVSMFGYIDMYKYGVVTQQINWGVIAGCGVIVLYNILFLAMSARIKHTYDRLKHIESLLIDRQTEK